MPRREEILASMRDALQILDPEWDIAPGSPEYKILEAVAQQGEALSFDSVLSDYHLDVDKKVGFELDLFMSLFGFARIRARRATGYVTFSRGTPALQDYLIPQGIQVYTPATETQSAVYYQTTTSAVLAINQTTVNVPIEAVVAGSDGNASVGEITGIATNNVAGITAVTNIEDVSGGRDAEADEDLKARWRRTVFRNISGTEDQFLGIAYNESAFVSRANLIGPAELYDEQVQITAPEDSTVTKPWEGILNGAMAIGANTFTVTDDATYDGYLNFSSHLLPDTSFYVAFYDDAIGTTVEEILKVVSRSGQIFTTETNALSNHGNGHMVRQVFPSGVTDAKFIYAQGGETVGINVGRTGQSIGVPNTDYEMIIAENSTITQGDGNPIPLTEDPPDGYISDAGDIVYNIRPFLMITNNGAKKWDFDTVIDFQYEFTPIASRNDPLTITDKVDLFVDGLDSGSVTEQTPFHLTDTDYIFDGGALGGTVVRTNYLRDDGLTNPMSDNFFMPLGKRPLSGLPDTISIGTKIYYKDSSYWLVKDITTLSGSERGADGIEWLNPKDPPVNSVTSGTGYNAAQGPFKAYTNATAGNLDGWYAYLWTYEKNGVESEPSPSRPTYDDVGTTTPEENVKGSLGKNTVQLEQANDSASTPVVGASVFRRIYRSKSSATQAEAEAGPFYLLKIVRDDGSDADDVLSFIDNKRDDRLRNIRPPSALPNNDGKLTKVTYNYNKLIERIDNNIDLVRLVGMDTMTHERDPISLKFNLAVVLTPGSTLAGALADIESNLDAWLRRKTFRNNIQIADLYDIVMDSFFVDNVRLASATEETNDWQVLESWSTRATPDPETDVFTINFDGETTGVISYNEGGTSTRETLEALQNIVEGNTYATTATINSTTNSITVDKKVRGLLALFPVDGGATWDEDPTNSPVYIQVENEIMRVRSIDKATEKTWTVTRGRVGSEKYAHGASAVDVHFVGDVMVYGETDGTGTGDREGNGTANSPYKTHIIFTRNGWTQTDNQGRRYQELLTTNLSGQAHTTVTKRMNGVGPGIQTVARNGRTIIDEYTEDFYLDSDQLPELHSVSLVLRAQNSF